MSSHAPPDATGDSVARLLAPQAARREPTVDDHMFRGPEQAPAPEARRLQLFAAAVRPVALAIQTIDELPSLINRAEGPRPRGLEMSPARRIEPPL